MNIGFTASGIWSSVLFFMLVQCAVGLVVGVALAAWLFPLGSQLLYGFEEFPVYLFTRVGVFAVALALVAATVSTVGMLRRRPA